MRLHPTIETVVLAYLELVDAEVPSLIEGLYLTGSTALEEFRPHSSDIDFVAVTSNPLNTAAMKGLRRCHARLRLRYKYPCFDGLYVTWADLSQHPTAACRRASSYEGAFSRNTGCGDPVTWQTLAQCGVVCRGPQATSIPIWMDRECLTQWTIENFRVYWQPLLARARSFTDRWRLISFTSYGCMWIVLGMSRLHYTLETGKIASKEQAGIYALDVFPSCWRPIVTESLRLRRSDRARPDAWSAVRELGAYVRLDRETNERSVYASPVARRRATLTFGDMLLADARDRFCRRQC